MEPILNVITVLIFLGVAQSAFLGIFFLVRGRDHRVSNRYLGLFLCALGAVILEMMLGYSGYVTHVIHLVDFSEPLNFVLGPLLYLCIRTRIRVEAFRRSQLAHFVPFALYALYHVPYMLQSGAFKHAAWLQAWRAPDASAEVYPTMNIDPLGLRSVVTELTIAHVLLYVGAAAWVLVGAFRSRGLEWWSHTSDDLGWMRSLLLQFTLIGLSVVAVKLLFDNDLGDHFIALLMTAIIYSTTASVIWRSSVLDAVASRPARKYEKSALTRDSRAEALARLTRLMLEEKPYLQPALSLADLAAKVRVSPHHLSQVLNEDAGATFHEYIAQHRIEEAKRLLSGPDKNAIRIEDVAERVGYYSKSSFNTAFRRLAGVTPSQFRDSQTV